MNKHLYQLAEKVGDLLQQQSKTLAVAESCTGGWIAKSLTDVPGSSHWFECGFITYSNRAKETLLGVAKTIIEQCGAVSEQTVKAMAEGALIYSNADIAVAVSGIAGPSGGRPEKPVGTVYLAWSKRNSLTHVTPYFFDGNRETIRYQAVAKALEGVLQHLSTNPSDRQQEQCP